MDSFVFLAKLCPSLPIIWKLLWLVGWPVWLLWWWMGERAFKSSLYLSPKVLEVSPMYSLSQPRSPHWYQYMAPLWLTIGSLSLGRPGGFWWYCHLWSGFECHIYHISFWYFHKDLVCRVWQCVPWCNSTGDSLGTCSTLVISPINDLTGRLVKSFLCLVQSPFGIFAFSKNLPEVVFFLLEQLRLAAHFWGPMGEGVDDTKFAERWWWLSHCRYWSVCVGFLYTVMDRLPSASGLTIVSKKGIDPSSMLSSTVNLMAGSTLLMCRRKPCLLASLWMTKVSSTNLCQNLGSVGQYLELFVLSTPYKW